MWYFYPCPKCGRPVSVFDNESSAEYDVEPKLIQAIKDHYNSGHNAEDLLLTDSELQYEVRNNKQSSESEPSW